ncbi:MAG TPA: DUF4197 domain-containing protein [Gammaproteobacteria bacterium]|nr:DUF4197 domain-containing protein [Gammaproteobacteria bacterium]
MPAFVRSHRSWLCCLLASTVLAAAAHAGPLDELLKLFGKQTQSTPSAAAAVSKTAAAALSNSEIASGLKEALAAGATKAIQSLGRSDGFWKNAAVRIPLPEALQPIGKLARQLGQGQAVDDFELSLNRAAEQAVPGAADIVGDAIRNMTLTDAQGILTGGDHAATDFLRRTAGDALAARIKPIVVKATDSVGVTRKYKALTSAGSVLGSAISRFGGGEEEANPLDLDDYVTGKTLDGLFTVLAEQEKAIRTDPAARTTDLLKKVFGG